MQSVISERKIRRYNTNNTQNFDNNRSYLLLSIRDLWLENEVVDDTHKQDP